MRSLIQLAGRIQRHRQQSPEHANLLILQKNYKALKGEKIAYAKPGFESHEFELKSKDLAEILLPAQYQPINAVPRIKERSQLDASGNLVDLEHAHLQAKLAGSSQILIHAGLWWRHYPDWCAELQRLTPFRQSAPEEEFVLYVPEEGEEPLFHLMTDTGRPALVDKSRFVRRDIVLAKGIQPWISNNAGRLLEDIAEKLEMSIAQASLKFGEIRLREREGQWFYSALFGVYDTLE